MEIAAAAKPTGTTRQSWKTRSRSAEENVTHGHLATPGARCPSARKRRGRLTAKPGRDEIRQSEAASERPRQSWKTRSRSAGRTCPTGIPSARRPRLQLEATRSAHGEAQEAMKTQAIEAAPERHRQSLEDQISIGGGEHAPRDIWRSQALSFTLERTPNLTA